MHTIRLDINEIELLIELFEDLETLSNEERAILQKLVDVTEL